MYTKGTSLIAEVKLNRVNHLGIPKAYRCCSLSLSLCHEVLPVSLSTPTMGTFNLELDINLEIESCRFSFSSLLTSFIGKQLKGTPFSIADPYNLKCEFIIT